MKGKSCIRCLLAVFLLWAPSAFGQTGDDTDPAVSKADTMVVTAGRIEEKRQDVSASVTVLTEEDIRESAVKDLGELLSKEGFMIREYPNSLTSVEIRGFRSDTHGNDLSSYVLILINGRRVGKSNLSQILTDNVERVEIIRGPASVQYGSSAMGGIINVITKQGKGKPALFVEGTLGSFNYQKTEVGGSMEMGGFDLSLSASTESQDDYTTADSVTYYNTGFDSKERISLNAGWTFIPDNRVGITYTSYDGDTIGSPDYLSANDLHSYVDNSIHNLDFTYDGRTADGFLIWNLRYFTGKDEYETYDSALDDAPSYFKDTDLKGAQGQVNIDWDFVRITTGFDWTHYEISNSYSVPGGENTYDNPAGFLLAKLNLMDDRLILSAGGRYDQYDVESDEGESKEKTNFSGNIGAVYKLTSLLSARANYAEAFKMPTADQLYMFDDYSAWGFGIWSGNPNLKPETSKTYEVGLDISKGPLFADLTYFTTDFKDRISYSYIPEEDLTRYENVEGAKVSGIEGSFGTDIGAYFNSPWEVAPSLSFTYLTERKDETTNTDMQYVPEWTASFGLRLANPDIGFVSRLNVTYTGEQDIIDYEGTGATISKDVTVVDLSILKTLCSFKDKGKFNLSADIRNLFNRDYELVQGYPSPGRHFFIGMKYVY